MEKKLEHFSHPSVSIQQSGFTLIEMAVVIVIAGIIISIMATVMPSLIRSSKIKQGRAVLEKVNYEIQGFITASGRLPFADSGTSGVEDSSTPTYFGNLPYVTLGLTSGDDAWGNRIKYGVYEDLTATDSVSLGTALGTSCVEPADIGKLHIIRSSDGSAVNMAYVIISGGPKDMDLDNSFFDDLNSDGGPDNAEYDDPSRIVTFSYDDLMIARSCGYVSGSQGYGIGTSAGTGTGTGVENTDALCSDDLDNDEDGKIDCHDQDCCSSGVTVCPDGCPPPTDVALVTSPQMISATVGETGFSHAFQATGGSGYYYWYLDSISPAVSGLSIDLTSGTLSGTVNACARDYDVDIRVADRYDSGLTDSHIFTLTINNGTLVITPGPSGLGDPADFTVGESTFKREFTINGDYAGPFTSTSPDAWTIQWLDVDPGGFQIDPVSDTTAEFKKSSGTTSRNDPYIFSVTATDDTCSDNSVTTGAYTIMITPEGTGAPYGENLVAEWHLDECAWDGTTGEVRDSGEDMLDGTAVNGANTTGAGKICHAGFFDGTDDYIEVPDSEVLRRTSAFSIALWVKVHDNASDWVRLAGKGDGTNRNYGVWLATNGTILFQIYSDGGNGNSQTAVTVNDGAWHHVLCVYDQATMKVYLDNVESRSINFSQDPRTSTDSFTIGYAGFHTYLNGRLDEVMLFHKALTTEEIDEIYNLTRSSCIGSCYSEPVAEYRMENFSWNGTAGEVEDTGSGSSNGVAAASGSGALPTQTTPSSGKICRAGSFLRVDANNGGYLDLEAPVDGDLDPGTGPWTISAWVSWDGSSGENIVYNKENLYETRVQSGYVNYAWQPHWEWDGGTSFPITADTWTYLTIMYDGVQQIMYKDGVEVYSRGQTGAIGSNSSKFLIGARGSGSPINFFSGMIDEVKIYNRALAENEISADMAVTRDCSADSVVITSTNLPGATVGDTGYTSGTDPAAIGGSLPYVWELVSQDGGLGLTMPDVSTGVLAGDIDVCAGTYNVTVRVTDNDSRVDEVALPLIVSNGTLDATGLPVTLNCDSTTCSWDFSVTGPIIGQLTNWTINWQGSGPGGFEVISTGSNTAVFRKIGTSTAAVGYQFTLSAEDSSCADNTLLTGTYTLNVAGSAEDAPYYAGMVAEWHMDECLWDGTADEVLDTGTQSAHGTSHNFDSGDTAERANGRECYAAALNLGGTTDQYVTFGSSAFNSLNDFSLVLWFRIETLSSSISTIFSGNAVGSDNTMLIYLNSAGTSFTTHVNTGSTGSFAIGSSVDDGQWHHLVWTRRISDGVETVFLDGTELADSNGGANTGTVTLAVGGAMIGQEQDSVGGGFAVNQVFHGWIDTVRLYNRALSQSEVDTLEALSHSCPSCN